MVPTAGNLICVYQEGAFEVIEFIISPPYTEQMWERRQAT